MKLLSSEVATVLRFELLSLLRDRRTIIMSIVVPAVLTPILMTAGSFMEQRRERRTLEMVHSYAVTGDSVSRAEAASLVGDALSSRGDGGGLRLEMSPGDPESSFEAGDAELLVDLQPSPSGRISSLRIRYRADSDESRAAAMFLADRLSAGREAGRTELLAARGISYLPDSLYAAEIDIAPPWMSAGARTGSLVVLFLLIFLLSGSSVVAVDTIAGERERGTLETLLASSASRADIIQAKFLAILSVSSVIFLTQLASLLVCLELDFVPGGSLSALHATPAAAVAALLLAVSLAVLVSAVMLLISAGASSVKDAQLKFFPIFLLALFPALAPVFPRLEGGFPLTLVPVAGSALGMRDLLAGRPDYLGLLTSFASNLALSLLALYGSWRAMSAERMVAGGEAGSAVPSPRLFSYRAGRIMAAVWAVTTIFALQAQTLDIRAVLAVNTVVFLGGGTLYAALRYRLGPRHLLLRAPDAGALALAVPGALSGMIAVLGITRLLGAILPVPPSQLEMLEQTLLPGEVPKLELLLFVALLPAVFEEIAFRGMFLGGLLRRMPAWAAVTVSALLFGFFHFQWFRIAPTALLGAMLGMATLFTGSVFPAILWHFLNNALAVVMPGSVDLGNLQPWIYLLAGATCAGCLAGMRLLSRRSAG